MLMLGEKKKKILKIILKVVVMAAIVGASFGAGLYLPGRNEAIKRLATGEAVYAGQVLGKYSQPKRGYLTQDENFSLFWDVWDALKKEYVDKSKLNEKELFYGAIKGMVASVGDPYTVFMDPKTAQEFESDMAGTFEGIGAEIGIRKDTLTVIAPLADSPAAQAGLRAGDKIYAIDGKSTAGITIDEAVNKIRGPKGTVVKLTILREGMEQAKEIPITRSTITVKSVTGEEVKGKDIYKITITNFNDDTKDLFEKEVLNVLAKNPKGIILDLRNNPGGYLDTAIDVASEWIDNGLIVTEKFSQDKKNDFSATGHARLKDYKTVILVNEGSASASEIVAGALKDHGKATLVGKTTFGKGSVQTLESLDDGSSLKVTVAKWMTPNGYNINEVGIKPDVEVDMTQADYDSGKDPQLDKAIEILTQK